MYMAKLTLSLFFVFFLNSTALGCPACAGSMDNPADNRLVWILVTFIAATYIPFFLLYKTVFKYRHLNRK